MCRDEANAHVDGVSGACHRRCRSWQQAIDCYRDAYDGRRVQALPEPGSIYWTMPMPISRSRPSRPSNGSDSIYWNSVEEDEQQLGADELSAYLSNINLEW